MNVRKSSLFWLVLILPFIFSNLSAETPPEPENNKPGESDAGSRDKADEQSDQRQYRELIEKLAARVQQLESLVASQQVRLVDMERRLSVPGSTGAESVRAGLTWEKPAPGNGGASPRGRFE